MRICFVSAEYPPMQGGVGDCTRQLARALMQLGHEVAVITSSRSISVGEEGDRSEPAVYRLVRRWDWASLGQVLSAVRTSQGEVLHVQYQAAAYGMHPAINLLPLRARLWPARPRLVVTFHDLRVPYLFPKAGKARPWVNRQLARWSDAVVATNSEDHALLTGAHLPSPPLLIPIGSNISPRLPAGYDRLSWRRALGVADNDVLLCYFGFLNESKGGETLFRSVAELAHRGHGARLLMIGGQVGDSDPTNRAYFEHINRLGDELGLSGSVLWTGFVPTEQVSAHFRAADICVLPYRDGASYRRGSFMAALAHGLPIVSTQPRVPIANLMNEENILLVPPDDAVAIANAVEQLVATPTLCLRLAAGALQLAKQFTWDGIAAQTAQLYRLLLGT